MRLLNRIILKIIHHLLSNTKGEKNYLMMFINTKRSSENIFERDGERDNRTIYH